MPRSVVRADAIIEFLRFCRCKKWYDKPRLHHRQQRYRSGLKKCLKAQCRVLLRALMPKLNSWDSVDAKNGFTCQDCTTDNRDKDWYTLDIHSFWSNNWEKAVLLFIQKWTKRSTPLSRFFRIKEWTSSGHQSLSLVSLVQSELVIPFFASTESQEFNSSISLHKKRGIVL